jgi:hypothetical protein
LPAADACIGTATRPCLENQRDQNICFANVRSYLDQVVEVRLKRAKAGAFDRGAYRQWKQARIRSCEASSEFSPDGSGYGASIDYCVAVEALALLQRGLRPLSSRFRPALLQ